MRVPLRYLRCKGNLDEVSLLVKLPLGLRRFLLQSCFLYTYVVHKLLREKVHSRVTVENMIWRGTLLNKERGERERVPNRACSRDAAGPARASRQLYSLVVRHPAARASWRHGGQQRATFLPNSFFVAVPVCWALGFRQSAASSPLVDRNRSSGKSALSLPPHPKGGPHGHNEKPSRLPCAALYNGCGCRSTRMLSLRSGPPHRRWVRRRLGFGPSDQRARLR